MATGLTNTRTSRLGSFGVPNTNNPSQLRSPQGSSPFSNASSVWNASTSIWASSNIRGSFGLDEYKHLKGGDSTKNTSLQEDGFEGKAGSSSLLASSESDGWPTRQGVPWNAATSTTSSSSTRQTGSLSGSPLGHRKVMPSVTNFAFSSNGRNDSPYFSPKISGDNLGGSGRPAQKTFLDSSASVQVISRDRELPSFGSMPPYNTNTDRTERSSAYSRSSISSLQGFQPTTFESGSVPGFNVSIGNLRNGAESITNANYSTASYATQTPKTDQDRLAHRSNLSVQSSFSSQSQFQQTENIRANSGREQFKDSSDLPTALGRLTLGETESSLFYVQTPSLDLSSPVLTQNDTDLIRPSQYSKIPNSPWNVESRNLSPNLGPFTPDSVPDGLFDQSLGSFRNSQAGMQDSVSPRSEFCRELNDNLYKSSDTPSIVLARTPSRGSFSGQPTNGQTTALDGKLKVTQLEQQPLVKSPQSPSQPRQHLVRCPELCSPSSMRFYYAVPPPYVSQLVQGRNMPREQDIHYIRSALLEEFKAHGKTSKRFELKDIYTHIVEFCGDQHGSRFIQQKLETANSDEKGQVFSEIQPNALQLMTDVFGNYVVQKIFEHGNQSQKRILAAQMKGHIVSLSMQMYGCRVVQKALEHILVDQQASLVKELDGNVIKCVKDQNGNHVVQKAIERVPAQYIEFIINAFAEQVQRLATHPYGCRVIQRMLEHCDDKARGMVLRELHACTSSLITDQYGNYVIQHVIEHGEEEDRDKIIGLVITQLVTYSKHKFASNVVEKSIQFGTDEHRTKILSVLTAINEHGETSAQLLVRDQYGNYVIQKLLTSLQGQQYDELVEMIRPCMMELRKYSLGKQVAAIDRLIAGQGATAPSLHDSGSPCPQEYPLAPTAPLLTADTRSPRSSSLSSAANSYLEASMNRVKPTGLVPCDGDSGSLT